MCARVFEEGEWHRNDDVGQQLDGVPNYLTEDERSLCSFPVEWRSDQGRGRIGVITISSRYPNSISDEFQSMIDLLANIVGFLFALYAIGSRKGLMDEGNYALKVSRHPKRGILVPNTAAGKRFATAVFGLRRQIAGYFEQRMLRQHRHRFKDGKLTYVKD